MMQKSKDFKLNVYIRHTRQRPKVNGQLVMLGYDVTTCTPASYQRCSLSLKEIADRYNFPDQSFFGRYFKKHTGMSPKEYRAKRI